jgi:hypothetical protein
VFKNKTGIVHIKVTLRRVPVTNDAVEKQLSIKYTARVSVAIVTQHAKRMLRIILSSVA